MPPKLRFTREEIVRAALELARAGGMTAVTARSLGAKLGSSTKPIFGIFRNMEEVQQEVLKAADECYQSYQRQEMARGEYPPYKASGMAYIRFATEERELFRLLFMRDRSHEEIPQDTEELRRMAALIQRSTGLEESAARQLHLEMWVFVHGIATMVATAYLPWDVEWVSRALTDAYLGLKRRFCEE